MLAEAKIKWGFIRPGTIPSSAEDLPGKDVANLNTAKLDLDLIRGDGIWIRENPNAEIVEPVLGLEESDGEEYIGDSSEEENGGEGSDEEDRDSAGTRGDENEESEGSEDDDDQKGGAPLLTGGRFGALSLDE